MEIKSAKKYLTNSMFKQLCHMTSELIEVWIAWIKWKLWNREDFEEEFAIELIDLQGSVQTGLEGPLNYTEGYIDYLRERVVKKNTEREGGSYY